MKAGICLGCPPSGISSTRDSMALMNICGVGDNGFWLPHFLWFYEVLMTPCMVNWWLDTPPQNPTQDTELHKVLCLGIRRSLKILTMDAQATMQQCWEVETLRSVHCCASWGFLAAMGLDWPLRSRLLWSRITQPFGLFHVHLLITLKHAPAFSPPPGAYPQKIPEPHCLDFPAMRTMS